MITIREAQAINWRNKLAKGFVDPDNPDVSREFCLLYGEVAEAFDAWRKTPEKTGEELADVMIYLLGLAEMIGVDLETEVVSKMATNAARRYRAQENGTLIKESP